MTFQRLQVTSGVAVVIEFEETYQWHDDNLMAIAQMDTGSFQLNAAVGLFDDAVQQVALGIGLYATTEWRSAVSNIPPGTDLSPVVVEFIVSKQVVERQLVAHLSALNVAGQLEQRIVQLVGIDMLADVGRIVK